MTKKEAPFVEIPQSTGTPAGGRFSAGLRRSPLAVASLAARRPRARVASRAALPAVNSISHCVKT
jgi:hypothetical protein